MDYICILMIILNDSFSSSMYTCLKVQANSAKYIINFSHIQKKNHVNVLHLL